jgi:hypothetical protein
VLVGLTCVGWALVASMHFWWSWLWARVGLVSVPVDTLVWLVAVALTVLVTPALWHRFHHTGAVVVVVGTLMVGGTAVVLPPWHDVLSQAMIRMECGPGNCTAPQPRPSYSWRAANPK